MELSDLCPNRRSQFSIVAEVLELAKRGASKNQIMCRVNLSSERLDHYLGLVVKNCLLGSFGICEFRTTSKGLRFLCYYYEALELLSVRTKKEFCNGVKIPPAFENLG
jgi:predicted transcriptional regulator